MELEDTVAIVTGAGQGLGRAITLAFAAEGAIVAVADIDKANARNVAEGIRHNGGRAEGVGVDVTDSDQVQELVSRVVDEFGTIDILVNNAGIVGPQGPIADLLESGFDAVVGVNLKGVYLCSKAAIPQMISQQSGKIVHIASIAGKMGEPFNGIYSATKAAVISLTQSMALELAPHGINVNSICPAAMDTAIMDEVYKTRAKYFGLTPDEFRHQIETSFPLPRKLALEDTANLAVFLASGKSEMITGQSISVSGGL
jgi:NAD(P)-dependent dehydrogenase (short-subunit alcohol dehydrogenase family)